MTRNSDRKARIRSRMAETGENYTIAARAVDAAAAPATREQATPMDGRWPAWKSPEWPAVASTYRDGDQRMLEILDAATGAVIDRTAVPWEHPDALVDAYDAAGLLTYFQGPDWAEKVHSMRPGRRHVIGMQSIRGCPHWVELHEKIRLGRPDLLVYRLGYSTLGRWFPWSDGTWRSQAQPTDRTHAVTVTPIRPDGSQVRITVQANPTGAVAAETVVAVPAWAENDYPRGEAINQALNGLGWTVKRWTWKELPGGVQFAAARVGKLAERAWWTQARVRVVRETSVQSPDGPAHTYRVGDELTMVQWGSAGDEVERDCWWTSTDLDYAYTLHPDRVQVLEVLEDIPPMWEDAVLTADQITAALQPHFPDAAAFAAAWTAAGLHVVHARGGLIIQTPVPERRRIGLIGYGGWPGDDVSTYEAVIKDHEERWNRRTRKLDGLPLDPVAAAATQESAR